MRRGECRRGGRRGGAAVDVVEDALLDHTQVLCHGVLCTVISSYCNRYLRASSNLSSLALHVLLEPLPARLGSKRHRTANNTRTTDTGCKARARCTLRGTSRRTQTQWQTVVSALCTTGTARQGDLAVESAHAARSKRAQDPAQEQIARGRVDVRSRSLYGGLLSARLAIAVWRAGALSDR